MTSVVCWNINAKLKPWQELFRMDADVALLQEVKAIPRELPADVALAPNGSGASWEKGLYDRWRRCQTNWIGPIEASIEGSQAASWRHSARAAVRCCLKTSRRVRWRWWLKWLWIEAWTAANFCRVLMSLNRAIAPSRLRNG